MLPRHKSKVPPARPPADFSCMFPISNTNLTLHLTALVKKVAWLGIGFAITDFSRYKKPISVSGCDREPRAPQLARLHPGGNAPLYTSTGIAPFVLYEHTLLLRYFMGQERDYSFSVTFSFSLKQQNSGPLDPGDHIVLPFNFSHP